MSNIYVMKTGDDRSHVILPAPYILPSHGRCISSLNSFAILNVASGYVYMCYLMGTKFLVIILIHISMLHTYLDNGWRYTIGRACDQYHGYFGMLILYVFSITFVTLLLHIPVLQFLWTLVCHTLDPCFRALVSFIVIFQHIQIISVLGEEDANHDTHCYKCFLLFNSFLHLYLRDLLR